MTPLTLFQASVILNRIFLTQPIILLGDTGCGKTNLIMLIYEFFKMPSNESFGIETCQTLNCNEFLNKEDVKKYLDNARKNTKKHIVFFDNLNTSPASSFIEHLFLNENCRASAKFVYIGALNPYKKMNPITLIIMKDKSVEKESDLMYQVNRLQEATKEIIFDFNPIHYQRKHSKENSFYPEDEQNINHLIIDNRSRFPVSSPAKFKIINMLKKNIDTCITFIRILNNECSILSYRDVERTITIYNYLFNFFYKYKPESIKESDITIISVIVSFILRLPEFKVFDESELNTNEQRFSSVFKPIFNYCFGVKGDKYGKFDGIKYEIHCRDKLLSLFDNVDNIKGMFMSFVYDYIQFNKINGSIMKFKSQFIQMFLMDICVKCNLPCFIVDQFNALQSNIFELLKKKCDNFLFVSTFIPSKSTSKDGIMSNYYDATFSEILKKANKKENNYHVVYIDDIDSNSPYSFECLNVIFDHGFVYNNQVQSSSIVTICITKYPINLATMNRSVVYNIEQQDRDDIKISLSLIFPQLGDIQNASLRSLYDIRYLLNLNQFNAHTICHILRELINSCLLGKGDYRCKNLISQFPKIQKININEYSYIDNLTCVLERIACNETESNKSLTILTKNYEALEFFDLFSDKDFIIFINNHLKKSQKGQINLNRVESFKYKLFAEDFNKNQNQILQEAHNDMIECIENSESNIVFIGNHPYIDSCLDIIDVPHYKNKQDERRVTLGIEYTSKCKLLNNNFYIILIANIDELKNSPMSKKFLDQAEAVYLDNELIVPYYLKFINQKLTDEEINVIFHQMTDELNMHSKYGTMNPDPFHSNIVNLLNEFKKVNFTNKFLTQIISQNLKKSIKSIILTKSKIYEDIYLPFDISSKDLLIENDDDIKDFMYLSNKIYQMEGKGNKLIIIKCSKFDKLHFAHLKYFFEQIQIKCNIFIIYYGCDPKEFEGLSTFKWPIFAMEDISIHPELDNYKKINSKELVQLPYSEFHQMIRILNTMKPDKKEESCIKLFNYIFDNIIDIVDKIIREKYHNISIFYDFELKKYYNGSLFKNKNYFFDLIRKKFEGNYPVKYFNIIIDPNNFSLSSKSQLISKVYQVLCDQLKSFFLFRFGSKCIQDNVSDYEYCLLECQHLDMCLISFLEDTGLDPFHYLFHDYCQFLMTNSTKFDANMMKLKMISDRVLNHLYNPREALFIFYSIFKNMEKSNIYTLSFTKKMENRLLYDDFIDLQSLIDFYHFRSFAGLNINDHQTNDFWDKYIIQCLFEYNEKLFEKPTKDIKPSNRSIMLNYINKYRNESIFDIFKSPITNNINIMSSICDKMLNQRNYQSVFEEKDKVYLAYKYFNESESSLINGPLYRMINAKLADKSITQANKDIIISVMMLYEISQSKFSDNYENLVSKFNLITNVTLKDLNASTINYHINKIDLNLPKFKNFGSIWETKYKFKYEFLNKENFIDEIQMMINKGSNENSQLRKLINLAYKNSEPLAIVALRRFLYSQTEHDKIILAKILDPYFGDIKIVDLFIDSIKDKIPDDDSFPFSEITSNIMNQINYNKIFKFSNQKEIINIFDIEKPYLAQFVWYHITFNNPRKYPLTSLFIKESSFFIDFEVVPSIINTIVHLRHFFSYNPVLIPIILHCTSLFNNCDCKLLLYSLDHFNTLKADIEKIKKDIDKFGDFLSLNYKESFENFKHRSSYYQIKYILKIYFRKYNEIVTHITELLGNQKELKTIEASSIFPWMLLTNISLIDTVLPVLYERKINNFEEIEEHLLKIFVDNNCFQILNDKNTMFPLFTVKYEDSIKDFVGFSSEDYSNMFQNFDKYELKNVMFNQLTDESPVYYHHSVMSFIIGLYSTNNKKYDSYKQSLLNTYEYSISANNMFYEKDVMYPLQEIFTFLPIEIKKFIRFYQEKLKTLKLIVSEEELSKIVKEIEDEEKILDYSKNRSLEDVFNSFLKNEIVDGFTNTSRQIILLGVCRSLLQLNKDKIYLFELEPRKIFLDEKFYPHLNTFYKLEANNVNHYKVLSFEEAKSSFKKQFIKVDVFSFGLIMYELITSTKLVANEKDSTSIVKNIMNGNLPEFPESISESFIKLIESCWSADPEKRPTFADIFYSLAYDSNYCLDDVDMNEYNRYIKSIVNDLVFCTSCSKIIEEDEFLYYSGFPYHFQCVKCMVCHKQFISDDEFNDFDDFLCVTPGLFICQEHYDEYQKTKKLDPEVLTEYHDKLLKNTIKESFDRPNYIDYDILNYRPNDIFIDYDLISNSYQVKDNVDRFVYSATFHFDKSPKEIDVSKFMKELSENMIIFYVKKGSTFIKVAFITTDNMSNIEQGLQDAVSLIRDKLNTAMGKTIVGNIIDEPDIAIPEAESDRDKIIQDFYGKKSINLLQNVDFLERINMKQVEEEVEKTIQGEQCKNWEFIFNNFELYEAAEKQVRNDIENNSHELIIIGQTIICNKHLKEYEDIKLKIPKESVGEMFLYHGSRLANHQKIVKDHFLMPGVDKINRKTDDGYYGKGIYATDNIFYSAMYTIGLKYPKFNEKVSVICCRGVFNQDTYKQIEDLSYDSQPIGNEVADTHGIHLALVGSSNDFRPPITEDGIDENFVVAHELVFPNKYQIIPICTFLVMRAQYYIFWFDENEANKNEHLEILKKLRETVETNIYVKNNHEKAINLLELKKRNKVKAIISAKNKGSAIEMIDKLHDIYNSSIVCLIFSNNLNDARWASKIENALFTSDPKYLNLFINENLEQEKIVKFAHDLENINNVKFRLNVRTITSFPLCFETPKKTKPKFY